MPDISVIIPTHNRRGFLEQAIQSCFAGNDNLDVEVIVVDDGSLDGTRDWLRQLHDEQVRPFFQEHQGAQVARNRGMHEAKGKFIKFLDDDDWLAPGSLEEQVQHIQRAQADVCYGNLRMGASGDEAPWTVRQHTDYDLASGIFRESIWTHPFGLLYRQDAVEDLCWDPSLPYHQDYAFALKVACRGAAAVGMNQVTGTIRQHAGLRIDTAKQAAPRAEYYALKIQLMLDGIRELKGRKALQPYHRHAAADGIWTWAHIIAAYDLSAFRDFYSALKHIFPAFVPSRRSVPLQLSDRMFDPFVTEHLFYPMRKLKSSLQSVG